MYKLRPAAYIVTHQYLNGMQQGIQSAHVISELFLGSANNAAHANIMTDWGSTTRTLKILNGGVTGGFDAKLDALKTLADQYGMPFATFREPDLFNSIAAFGVVVSPELARKLADQQNKLKANNFVDMLDDNALIKFFSKLRTAR